MPFWRRDEPAHERLAREAGIELDDAVGSTGPEPAIPQPRIPVPEALVAIHGVHRHREWDAIASAEAPELRGDELEFTALPDGTLLIDEDVPEGALTPLADALEQTLAPPYGARAVRREDDVWAVAANRIDVVEVPEEVDGDTVSLAVQRDERALLVDERPSNTEIPTLEAFALERHREFVLHAERLDGELWAVKVNAL